jgi:hypothetical protein
VIISDRLSNDETRRHVATLEKYRSVIGYSLKDLKGISSSLCTRHIPMEQEHKHVREHQPWPNNAMRECHTPVQESGTKASIHVPRMFDSYV